MKSRIIALSIVLVSFIGYAFLKPVETLEIGQTTPAFAELTTGIDGTNAPLRSYLKSNGILVMFSCNTCPFVIAWEDRYTPLAQYCEQNNIGFVLVNSNAARRNGDDSHQAMVDHAKEMKYSFPYVVDHNATIADMMGAKTTPHAFFFNKDMELVYKGAIDDNHKDAGKVSKTYLLDAMRNHLAGVAPSPAVTNALGCSIKRVK